MSATTLDSATAWAKSHGCRGIMSCNASPLQAFTAGEDAERESIRNRAIIHGEGWLLVRKEWLNGED